MRHGWSLRRTYGDESSADASSRSEREYLDTVVRNGEKAIHRLEPVTEVVCGNVVVVIRQDLSPSVKKRLNQANGCSQRPSHSMACADSLDLLISA